MRYQVLGKAGIQVSRLSFGASALGGVFREIDETEGIRAVHAALDGGINYFDVAPAYGGSIAESVLGKALKGVSRDRYYLSTKVGKYTNPESYGEDVFDYSEKRIRASIEESSQRLGCEYFDIIHLHDIEYQGGHHVEWALSEGFDTLQRLKEEGRIGSVSFGIYPLGLWKRILETLPIDAMMLHNHYTLNDTSALELLPTIKSKSIGLINASPFSSGLLTGNEAPDWHPATEQDRSYFRNAARFCEERGIPLAKLALQFSSSHPEIPTTLFSSARVSSVVRNIQWHEEPCDWELVAEVQRILAPVRNKQWDYDAGVARVREDPAGG